jgi:Protein of unknown function (DUF3306)
VTTKPIGSERFSLARWSQRKLAAGERSQPAAPPNVSAPAQPVPAAAATAELPPVESLSFESDFTPFLRPGVDPTVQRAALKQLFRDTRFNVMDGLDVYIDDYTKPDPIPPDMLAELMERFDFKDSVEPANTANEKPAALVPPSTVRESAQHPDEPAAVIAPPLQRELGAADTPSVIAPTENAATPIAPELGRDDSSHAPDERR